MQKKYILALDQGTTSSRSILFDLAGNIMSLNQMEFKQIYPKPGWVEHDPESIAFTQLKTATLAISEAKINPEEIACIGITNQRETTIVWDKNTGKPLYNAIVWQCRRTSEQAEALAKAPEIAQMIQDKTGLRPDAYFSATKIQWILNHVDGAKEKAQIGDLLFGTVDCYLLWLLTGVHATDYTNASRTLLFNIHTLDWDEDLLNLFSIPRSMLPKVQPSISLFGISKKSIFGAEIPITGIAGDQHAALFGQCCFEEGQGKNTYGTGCFLMMNTGKKPVLSKNGLITTIAWGDASGVNYALEGSVYIGGAVLQWLRDELKIIDTPHEADIISEQTKNGGIYFVPAFTGLGAPYWDMEARGCIYGITRGTTRANIIRASLESIAFQTSDLVFAMQEDLDQSIKILKVDGGASRSDVLLQLQSDLINLPVEKPLNIETTAQGVAMMAGLGAKVYKNKEELIEIRKTAACFKPNTNRSEADKLLSEWKNTVKRVILH